MPRSTDHVERRALSAPTEPGSRSSALLGLVLALAASALALRALPEEGLAPFGPPATLLALALLSLALLGGLVAGASEARGAPLMRRARHLRLPSREDLRCALPSLALLLFAPLAREPALLAALSALALVALVVRAPRDVTRPEVGADGRGVLDLYAGGLFLLAGLVAVDYLAIALEMVGSRDNDAAYYFGVARFLAAHGRLEEPIVWNFLAPPAQIVHPAFDYWQGLTSLVLAIPLALFGRTHLVASVAMASLSALAVLLFTYLVTIARPLASRAGQLAAILAFAYAPAMQTFRFDTETSVVFQLALTGALVAIATERLALAAVLSFLVFLTRADGIVTVAIVWLFLALRAIPRARDLEGRPALLRLVAAMLGALGLYVGSNLARFGAPTPPGARLAPFLTSYGQLYTLDPHRAPGTLGELLSSRLRLDALGHALTLALGALERVAFVLAPGVLVAALALGVAVFARPRTDRSGLHRLSLTLVLVGSVLVAWASPVVFAEWRTLHGLLPAMVLAAAMSAELPSRALAHALQKKHPALGRALFALGTAALLVPTLLWLSAYRPAPAPHADYEAELASLDPILEGANVATTSPWWVIANTESPAILLPFQGEATLARVLRLYRVDYVLFSRGDVEGFGADAWRVWEPLRSGARPAIGPYRLERVHRGPHVTLYRVVR